ncbi:MAG: MFS transporter [Pseudomonadota bacterium]
MPLHVYVLALGAFSLITTEFGIIGMLPQLSSAFGVSIETAAWLLSGFALVIALFGPAMTLACSAVNRKLAFTVVLACFVAANVWSAFATEFKLLLALRLFLALLHPVFWAFAIAVAASSVEEKDSPRAVSIVFLGLSAGTVLGVPLVAYVTDAFGWSGGFMTFALLNGVSLIAMLLALPSLPVTQRLTFSNQLGVLCKASLWSNLIVLFFIMASIFSIYGFFAEYMQQVVGVNGRTVSILLLLFGAAGFVGNLVAGKLITISLPGAVYAFLAGLAVVLLCLYGTSNLPLVVTGIVVVWGFVHAAGFLLGQTVVARSTKEAPEFGNALFASIGNAGVAFGTFVGALVIADIGTDILPLFAVAMLAVTAIGFVIAERLQSRMNRSPIAA